MGIPPVLYIISLRVLTELITKRIEIDVTVYMTKVAWTTAYIITYCLQPTKEVGHQIIANAKLKTQCGNMPIA